MATNLGQAGTGLVDAPWARNAAVAAVGRKGELRCAKILGELPRGAVVLHDLSIPIRGPQRPNVDHAVVIGAEVTLIDAKSWKPGFYWTVGSTSFRGLRRFKPAESGTMPMALNCFRPRLPGATMCRPIIAVLASNSSGPVRVRFLKMRGCRVVNEHGLRRIVRQMAKRTTAADTTIVAELSRHLNRS